MVSTVLLLIMKSTHLTRSKIRLLMIGMTITLLIRSLLWNTASASPPQPEIKSFAEWCRQKEFVAEDTRHTIDVLLAGAGSKDCQKADSFLKTLTELYLSENKLTDVKPLAALTNLTKLDLRQNQIADVKPLAALTNLNFLFLSKNKITDMKPLVGLTKLTTLYFSENQLTNVKPLAALTKLTNLDFFGNPIAIKICPIKPATCIF
jgi:internalin A